MKSILSTLFILMLTLQIPSLCPLVKYASSMSSWMVPGYLLLTLFLYSCLLLAFKELPTFKKILDSHVTLICLLAVLLLINAMVYPHELALQAIGRGSDQSDALIRSGALLFSGHFPYSVLTYLHNPISPGPGWILMTMPFTLTGLYVLFVPFVTTMSAFFIRKITNSTRLANLYLIFLFSSLSFWQTSVTGIDYVAVGMVFGLVTMGVFSYWSTNRLVRWCFIILASLSATARVSFIYFGPLLGVFLWKKNKIDGLYLAISTLVLTVLTHVGFYLWDPAHYAPLHVFFDKPDAVPYFFLIATGLCFLIAVITLLRLKVTLSSWMFFLWLCLAAPLLILDLGAIIQNHWIIAENLNMVAVIIMPIAAMWASMVWCQNPFFSVSESKNHELNMDVTSLERPT